MADQTVGCVWYLPHENRLRDPSILVYRDTGKLTMSENSIEFRGDKETVVIRHIKRVAFESRAGTSLTIGFKIEYGETTPAMEFFSDGSHSQSFGSGGSDPMLSHIEKSLFLPFADIQL